MRFLVLLIVVLASCAPSATPQTVAPNPALLETVRVERQVIAGRSEERRVGKEC